SGRSVQHERRNLAREALDRCAIVRTHAYTQLNLWCVPPRVTSEWAVRGGCTDEFRENLIEAQAQAFQSLAEDTIGELRLFERVGPRIHERADGLVTGFISDRHLELVGRCVALDSEYANAIRSRVFDADRGEIGNHVRRDVAVRVAHFLNELLRYSLHRHAATGVGMLGDDKAAILVRVCDRITDVGEIGNVAPVVLAVAAGALRTALEYVTGDDPGSKPVVIGVVPAVLEPDGRHRESRIGRASRNDDLRLARQSFDDRLGADVRIGRQDAIANRFERLAGFHVRQCMSLLHQLVQARQQIVARHHTNAYRLAALLRHALYGSRARGRIHTACIRDDTHSALGH